MYKIPTNHRARLSSAKHEGLRSLFWTGLLLLTMNLGAQQSFEVFGKDTPVDLYAQPDIDNISGHCYNSFQLVLDPFDGAHAFIVKSDFGVFETRQFPALWAFDDPQVWVPQNDLPVFGKGIGDRGQLIFDRAEPGRVWYVTGYRIQKDSSRLYSRAPGGQWFEYPVVNGGGAVCQSDTNPENNYDWLLTAPGVNYRLAGGETRAPHHGPDIFDLATGRIVTNQLGPKCNTERFSQPEGGTSVSNHGLCALGPGNPLPYDDARKRQCHGAYTIDSSGNVTNTPPHGDAGEWVIGGTRWPKESLHPYEWLNPRTGQNLDFNAAAMIARIGSSRLLADLYAWDGIYHGDCAPMAAWMMHGLLLKADAISGPYGGNEEGAVDWRARDFYAMDPPDGTGFQKDTNCHWACEDMDPSLGGCVAGTQGIPGNSAGGAYCGAANQRACTGAYRPMTAISVAVSAVNPQIRFAINVAVQSKLDGSPDTNRIDLMKYDGLFSPEPDELKQKFLWHRVPVTTPTGALVSMRPVLQPPPSTEASTFPANVDILESLHVDITGRDRLYLYAYFNPSLDPVNCGTSPTYARLDPNGTGGYTATPVLCPGRGDFPATAKLYRYPAFSQQGDTITIAATTWDLSVYPTGPNSGPECNPRENAFVIRSNDGGENFITPWNGQPAPVTGAYIVPSSHSNIYRPFGLKTRDQAVFFSSGVNWQFGYQPLSGIGQGRLIYPAWVPRPFSTDFTTASSRLYKSQSNLVVTGEAFGLDVKHESELLPDPTNPNNLNTKQQCSLGLNGFCGFVGVPWINYSTGFAPAVPTAAGYDFGRKGSLNTLGFHDLWIDPNSRPGLDPDPNNPVTLWAATNTGVWKYDQVYTSPIIPVPFCPATNLSCSYVPSRTACPAICDPYYTLLFDEYERTKNSWQCMSCGLAGAAGIANSYSASTAAGNNVNRLLVLSDRLYAAAESGLYRSLDSGNNWSLLLAGPAYDVKATSAGLLVSRRAFSQRDGIVETIAGVVDDTGATAVFTESYTVKYSSAAEQVGKSEFSVNPAYPNSVLWGTGPFFYHSVDGGVSFERLIPHVAWAAPAAPTALPESRLDIRNTLVMTPPAGAESLEEFYAVNENNQGVYRFLGGASAVDVNPYSAANCAPSAIVADNNCLNGIFSFHLEADPDGLLSGGAYVQAQTGSTPEIAGFPAPQFNGFQRFSAPSQGQTLAVKDQPVSQDLYFALRTSQLDIERQRLIPSAPGPLYRLPQTLPVRYPPFFNAANAATYQFTWQPGVYDFLATLQGKNFRIPEPNLYWDGTRVTNGLPAFSAVNEAMNFIVSSPHLSHTLRLSNPRGDAQFSMAPLVTVTPSAGDQAGGTSVRIAMDASRVAGINLTAINSITVGGIPVAPGSISFNPLNPSAISFITPQSSVTGAMVIVINASNPKGAGTLTLAQAFTYISSGSDVDFTSNFGPTVGGTEIRISGTAGFGAATYNVGDAVGAHLLVYSGPNCTGATAGVVTETPIRISANTTLVRTPRRSRLGCAGISLDFPASGGGVVTLSLTKPFYFHEETLASGAAASNELRLADSLSGLRLDIAGGLESGPRASSQPAPERFRDFDFIKSGFDAGRWAFGVTANGNGYLYDVPNRRFLSDFSGNPRRLGDDLPPAGGSATNGLSLIRVAATDRPFALGLPNFICRTSRGCTQVLYAAMAAFDANPNNLTFGNVLERRFGPSVRDADLIVRDVTTGSVTQKRAYGFLTIEQIASDPAPLPGDCMFAPVDAPPVFYVATHLYLLVVDATRELCAAGSGSNCTGGWSENPRFMCNLAVADLGDFAATAQGGPDELFSPAAFVQTNSPAAGAGKIIAANTISGAMTSFAFDPATPGATLSPTPITPPAGHTSPRFLRTIGTGTGAEFIAQFNDTAGSVTSFLGTTGAVQRDYFSSSCQNGYLAAERTFTPVNQTRFSYACPAVQRTEIWYLSDFDPPISRATPSTAINFNPVNFTPAAAAMTQQETPQFIMNLYGELVATAPSASFDHSAHQQVLLNYYNQTVAPDLTLTSLTSSQRQGLLARLRNLKRDTDRWVTDTPLRLRLDSLVDGAVASLP